MCVVDILGFMVGSNLIFMNEGVFFMVFLRKKFGDVCYYFKEFLYLLVVFEVIEIRIDYMYDIVLGVKVGMNFLVYV